MREFLILAVLTVALPARAEMLTLEQKFGGIVCESCATSLQRALGRMRGIESVEIDMTAGVARCRFLPENRIQLETIQDRIKGAGFTPGESSIAAIARIAAGENGLEVQLVENGKRYPVNGEVPLQDISAGAKARIEGTIEAPSAPQTAPSIRISTAVKQ